MPTFINPLPPTINTLLLLQSSSKLLYTFAITNPFEVRVPLFFRPELIKEAANDYHCSGCKFQLTEEEKAGKSPVELQRLAKETAKCVGTSSFGSKRCLAGFDNEESFHHLSVAEFTTPYLGLFSEMKLAGSKKLGVTKLYEFGSSGSFEKLIAYRNFNVFNDARICWGRRTQPATIKECFQEFFNTTTNRDLTSGDSRYHSFKRLIEKYVGVPNILFTDWLEREQLSVIKAITDPKVTGVLISDNAKWVSQVNEKSLIDIGDKRAVVGIIKQKSSATGLYYVETKRELFAVDITNSNKKPTLLGSLKELGIATK